MQQDPMLLESIKTLIDTYCQQQHQFDFNPNHPHIRLHEPTISSGEIFAALETLLSTYTTMGKKVKQFEKAYAEYCQSPYSVMSNSGSSANLLSIAALCNPLTPNHLKPGDEVLVPALSWSTTIWPLIQHQLVPVLVDCDLSNLNMDYDQLEAAISPKTRALMLVHVYGNPCNMDAIQTLTKKYHLYLIEDACEAMGAQYAKRPVGSFGDIANFSLFFSHHISTMEGGISSTPHFELAEMMRILRAHGWSREAEHHAKYVTQYPQIDPRFIFVNQGYNLRPTELNAAMGLIQLPKLNEYIRRRRETAKTLRTQLKKYAMFFQFQEETLNGEAAWFGFSIIIKPHAPFTVKSLTQHLQQYFIETRPIIAGNMARHPGMQLYPYKCAHALTQADYVMQQGFAIPCHQGLNQAACDYIVSVIDDFMKTTLKLNETG